MFAASVTDTASTEDNSSVLFADFLPSPGRYPVAPHGYSLSSTLEPADLLRLLARIQAPPPFSSLLRLGAGWPLDAGWYTFPAPPHVLPVRAICRKSQLVADGVVPAVFQHNLGLNESSSLRVRGLVGSDGVGGPTWVQPDFRLAAQNVGAGLECVRAVQIHASEGLGHGSATLSLYNDCQASASVRVWHPIPWFVSLVEGSAMAWYGNAGNTLASHSFVREVQAAVDRGQPALYEWNASIPSGDSLHFSFSLTSVLLHAEELPPNTHHGVQLLPLHVTWRQQGQEEAVHGWWMQPILIELLSPDFSMPYNVITFVGTALAFTAGSILNAISRKPKASGKGEQGSHGGVGGSGRRLCSTCRRKSFEVEDSNGVMPAPE